METGLLTHPLLTAVGQLLRVGILVVALALVAMAVWIRVRRQRTVFVRTFGHPSTDPSFPAPALSERLRSSLQEIQFAHQGGDLFAAGEATRLGVPQRVREDLGSLSASLVAEASPLGLVFSLLARFWPTLDLDGEVVPTEGGALVCHARLRRGGRAFHAWSVPVEETGAECLAEVADELAHRIVLDTARLPHLEGSGTSSTRDWRAFRALTRAIRRWEADDFRVDDPGSFGEVDALLTRALEHDPGYALAWYNRGALHMSAFQGAAEIHQALEYFRRAQQAARVDSERSAGLVPQVDRRVEGLAWVGISRCLSQKRHRYGRIDEAVVTEARQAGQEAVTLLGREDPAAMQALAFAWHCTERLDDIRKGQGLYRALLRAHPGRFAVTHNNLGYILMKGGEELRRRGREDEADRWWVEAEAELQAALRIAREGTRIRDFAHANLGNLRRLQERYPEAEAAYLRALHPDPERSRYTNGLNELALLYFQWGRTDDGWRLHRRALEVASDDAHRGKLRAQLEEAMADPSLLPPPVM